MTSTTIRINPDEKTMLEKIQAKIFLKTGKKLSLPELMKLLLKENEEKVLRRILDEIDGEDDIDWQYHLDFAFDMGETSADDIDDVIYG